MSQGEKNVQSDWDSNPGPSEYRSVSYPAAYTSSPLNSEQFWTVTYSYKNESSEFNNCKFYSFFMPPGL
jgi:hypothetical protein